eukprot:TRINITY_DN2954_c0_g1_i1.p1 TRINITY_DN2954_c0_g1~~TRINITY_DN2954_c0_g1_i1.p1  ORF type:complete len:401 (+),score=54.50 TRINITY_DN2954_c0_g1_i1:122-1324(+)
MQALEEVMERLELRRRFISPCIRNMDTGEIFTASEMHKVPQGIQHLGKNPRRVDLGEWICRPCVCLLPARLHPNVITVMNHLCNWVLLGLSFISVFLPQQLRVAVLISCALVNFICMMLDCFDGMHARATNQCSKLGELLDHWLDAIHVPMVTGGSAFALSLSRWVVALAGIGCTCLYGAQLIHYHYGRVFRQTSGVEGQIGTSFFYIVAAIMVSFDSQSFFVIAVRSYVIPIGLSFTVVTLLRDFVARFDHVMYRPFYVFVTYNALVGLLFLHGDMSVMAYVMVTVFISFRIIGSYVLYSILERPYVGMDPALIYWLLLFVWMNYVVAPVPVLACFTSLLPYMQAWLPSVYHILEMLTLQDLLPLSLCLYVGKSNLQDLLSNLHLIKHFDMHSRLSSKI